MEESINSIFCYKSAWDLLRNETTIDPEKDYQDWLQHFDDYNPIAYYVVNEQVVITADDINGQVYQIQDIGEFLLSLRQAYLEEEKQ